MQTEGSLRSGQAQGSRKVALGGPVAAKSPPSSTWQGREQAHKSLMASTLLWQRGEGAGLDRVDCKMFIPTMSSAVWFPGAVPAIT